MNYTSTLIEYCTVISDARASEIKKCKDLPILFLSKPFCVCKSPIEVRLVEESSFRICNKISLCGEKCTLDQRISEYPFNLKITKIA